MKSLLLSFVLGVAVAAVAVNCGDSGAGQDLGACEGVTCSGYGECRLDAQEEAYCVCEQGYVPDQLECVAYADPCDGVTCSDHGNCVVGVNDQPECDCDLGYVADGLACVEDTTCDPGNLRQDALTNGNVILSGVTMAASTPIADILANMAQYEGQVLQIEGIVIELCTSAGCWSKLADPQSNSMNLKVVDGLLDFRNECAMGYYMVGEGVFTEFGGHGPQVEIDNYGAVCGTIDCS